MLFSDQTGPLELRRLSHSCRSGCLDIWQRMIREMSPNPGDGSRQVLWLREGSQRQRTGRKFGLIYRDSLQAIKFEFVMLRRSVRCCTDQYRRLPAPDGNKFEPFGWRPGWCQCSLWGRFHYFCLSHAGLPSISWFTHRWLWFARIFCLIKDTPRFKFFQLENTK